MPEHLERAANGETCRVCGAHATYFDQHYHHGWICNDHPAVYHYSTRHLQMFHELAERQWREDNARWRDPAGLYQYPPVTATYSPTSPTSEHEPPLSREGGLSRQIREAGGEARPTRQLAAEAFPSSPPAPASAWALDLRLSTHDRHMGGSRVGMRVPVDGTSPELQTLRTALEDHCRRSAEVTGQVMPIAMLLKPDAATSSFFPILRPSLQPPCYYLEAVLRYLRDIAQTEQPLAVAYACDNRGQNDYSGPRQVLIHVEDRHGHCRKITIPFTQGLLPHTFVVGPASESPATAEFFSPSSVP